MATCILSAARSVGKSSWLTVGDVAARYSVHPQSVRLWCDNGELPCTRIGTGNHRRISLDAARFFFEGVSPSDLVDEREQENSSGVVFYCRVSSYSQKESLDAQEARLRSEISRLESLDPESIKGYRDCSSSFGDRPGLNGLVSELVSGKNTIRRIYITYRDRLSRVPSLTRLIEFLCKQYGATIVCLDNDNEIDPSDVQESTRELVEFVQVLGNRASAKKSAYVRERILDQPTIDKMLELREQGHDCKSITRILKQEGHSTSRRNGQERQPIDYYVVHRWLDKNGREGALRAVTGRDPQASPSTFTRWATDHLRLADTARTPIREVYRHYVTWCAENRLAAECPNQFGLCLSQFGAKKCKSGGVRSAGVVVD